MISLLTVFGLFSCISSSYGSLGDIFPIYKDCRESCETKKCSSGGDSYLNPASFPLYVRLLWGCAENCKYECMWVTVDGFQKKGWPPPQFHGKWPFARFLGVQEPASTFFSILNFAMHARNFRKFISEVRSDSPMYYLWCFYAVVCFNAWFWSTVFHTRDILFTETMDYLSAFSMVFYSIYMVGMRTLQGKKRLYSMLVTLTCAYLFFQHALYLIVGGFDYKYNMLANIAAGVLSGVICAGWSLLNWYSVPHARFIFLTVSIIAVTTFLEIAEFPPYIWILDAHALWHCSTIPVPYFFWRFAIEDCKYLKKQMHRG